MVDKKIIEQHKKDSDKLFQKVCEMNSLKAKFFDKHEDLFREIAVLTDKVEKNKAQIEQQ